MGFFQSLSILRSLRYRNYRLYFAGQGISLIGTWMQQVAMSWLVYRLGNSAFLLGVVAFAHQAPGFIMPLAGVLLDRTDRRKVLLVTQTLALIQASTMAVLSYTGLVAVWHVIGLSLFMGLINAFDMPGRQSFAVEMVEHKEDLGNVIALNSSQFNGARLIGPAIAGMVIAHFGESACFFLNALSFAAVIAALWAMRFPSPLPVADSNGSSIILQLKEGFSYVKNTAAIRTILFLTGWISLLGVPFWILMPVLAREIFSGGPRTLGFLASSIGLGALIGTLTLATLKNIRHHGKIIVGAAVLFGISLAGFSFTRSLWIALPLAAMAGFGMITHLAASNTTLQVMVDDDKRGRVMSYYTMSFTISTPIGSLVAGSLAQQMGAPRTILLGALCCLAGTLCWARKITTLHAAHQAETDNPAKA
jgi:MFS family permease